VAVADVSDYTSFGELNLVVARAHDLIRGKERGEDV
jgi:hypothetical protein